MAPRCGRSTWSLGEIWRRLMVTKDVLELFLKWRGNVDAWQHVAPEADAYLEKPLAELEDLLQRLTVVAGGRASVKFAEQTERDLANLTADATVRESIRSLATEAAARASYAKPA